MTAAFNEKTKHSKLYSNVYWGSFSYDPVKDKDMDVIFQNRNSFATEFKLKKVLQKGKPLVRLLLNYSCMKHDYISNCSGISEFSNTNLHHDCDYYDHVEVYETTDNNILILSSPYTKNDDKYKEFLTTYGFIDTALLYNSNAVSFYKVYSKTDIQIIKNDLKNKLKKTFKNI